MTMRKGFGTLEWIVIAAVALIMVSYVLGYWQSVWGSITLKADTAKEGFTKALDLL